MALLVRSAAAQVTVDYPAESTVFPPDFPAPSFVWRDTAKTASEWSVEFTFADGGPPLTGSRTRGRAMTFGEIDKRAISATNALPKLTAKQAAAHTWRPDASFWQEVQKRSVQSQATVTITGYAGTAAVSKGQTRIQTSADPVGAPIFYRDVPLMPSPTEKGIIKPLAQSAIPLINWRLRDVTSPASTIVMTGIHTCANCHSFSADGRTMGMDVDGPQNHKGLYALMPVQKEMAIQSENVIEWSTFRGKLGGQLRVGFMSQVSPGGSHVITTINETATEESEYRRRKSMTEVSTNYYVANFLDYRFLQVFFPTRGILAWYSRDTRKLQPLPGADDSQYVQTNAVWSPDGKYVVFARASAKDPYTAGGRMATHANDAAETQIRYDLYRVPFNEGRGGVAEPIRGASNNGMSNSFPKISPDGRWIVFVKAKNGLLMRPDSELWIVPASGGEARRMLCNTSRMNSWHSFSPNGKWMVFSSKARTPYTEMFLTHIDENGNDTPAVLIENSKAANRAVNLPEFVNMAADGLTKIDPVVTRYYSVADAASALMKRGDYKAAEAAWRNAVELNPSEARAHNNLGFCLTELGRTQEAVKEYEKALELSPEYPEALNNLGTILMARQRLDEAIVRFRRALELNPAYGSAHSNMGIALSSQGRMEDAIEHLREGARLTPDSADAHNNLAVSLAMTGRWRDAVPELEAALRLTKGRDPLILDLLSRAYAEIQQFPKAAEAARRGAWVAQSAGNARLAGELAGRAAVYAKGEIPR